MTNDLRDNYMRMLARDTIATILISMGYDEQDVRDVLLFSDWTMDTQQLSVDVMRRLKLLTAKRSH